MRRMLSGLAALALGAVASSNLAAQTCLGLNSPTNLQLSAAVGNHAKEFGADVNFGKSTGAFFGVGGHYTSFDDDAGNSKGAHGTIGLQLGAGSEKKLAVCPIAQVGFSSGPTLGTVKLSDIEVAGGLSVGIPVAAGSNFTIIPTASLFAIYDRAKAKTGSVSATSTDGFGVLSGGVGLMFSPRFVLQPSVSIPIGLEGSDPTFGIIASIGFGKGK